LNEWRINLLSLSMTDLSSIGMETLESVVALDGTTHGSPRPDFFVKRFQAQKKHPHAFVSTGAFEADELVGFACCHLLQGEFGGDRLIAVLDALSVKRSSQGLGIGHDLIRQVSNEIRSRGGRELNTQAGWNEQELLGFFTSAGFSLAPRMILQRSTHEVPSDIGAMNELAAAMDDGPNEVDFSDPGSEDYQPLSRDKVLVRSLSEDDLGAVARIDMKITNRDRHEFYRRKFEEVLYESGVRISLIAEIDGAVVGFMMARVDFGEFGRVASEAVIDTLGVAPAFQSRSVGHALLSQLLINLASLKVDTVRSEVEWNNFGLLGFLESCGFNPSQRLALSFTVD